MPQFVVGQRAVVDMVGSPFHSEPGTIASPMDAEGCVTFVPHLIVRLDVSDPDAIATRPFPVRLPLSHLELRELPEPEPVAVVQEGIAEGNADGTAGDAGVAAVAADDAAPGGDGAGDAGEA